jgi:hypothetical protein
MSLRSRVRSLERQAGRPWWPRALHDVIDWEIATLVAERTGRSPAAVMALSGTKLLALVGLSVADVFGEEAP